MTAPHYTDDAVTLYHGDCLDVLAGLPDASIDSVVTDPPYGLEFMGKDWDAPWKRDGENLWTTGDKAEDLTGKSSSPFIAAAVNNYRAGLPFQQWCELWARECLRVLKPGGHLLAFGGTRTWHRLACAVEDAGFEIRDNIAWLYGSGFPKSLDVSKAIDKAAGHSRASDYEPNNGNNVFGNGMGGGRTTESEPPVTDDAKRWAGWGTALKPAFEPCVVARKPLCGTVAGNVLAHGVGALNIDATRVATADSLGGGANKGMTSATRHEGFARPWMDDHAARDAAAARSRDNTARAEALGRWPSNVVIDGHAAAEIDRQSGHSVCRPAKSTLRGEGSGSLKPASGVPFVPGNATTGYDDEGGASRFFPTFRYQAKAATDERPTANGIAHPTVKPLDLMRWLVRLVTPPGGTVLEPFAGSGTTAEACIHEHMKCIAIEREADYLPLIVNRLSKPMEIGFDFGSSS